MVSFALNERQEKIRQDAATVAKEVLGPSYEVYSKYPDQLSRFLSTKPFYERLVTAGYVKAMIPKSLGGTSESYLDMAVIIEEFYAVNGCIMNHVVGTALGLLPLIIGGTPEQQQKFLAPFLSESGDAIAGLAHSEPGGTANFLEKGGKGLGCTAKKDGDFYIINGDKLWTTNSAGWDGKGAALCLLCVRYSETGGPEDPNVDPATNIMVMAITRDIVAANPPEAYQVLDEPDLMGYTGVTGPHTRYTNFKVPADHLLFAPDKAMDIIEKAFGVTAALVGAMALGTMREAFERAITFSKSDSRGGSVPIIERQSVADLLINAKIKTDTSRLVVWKALDCLENGPGDASSRFESCLAAKIYATDSALPAVFECMQAVGMTSYADKSGFPKLLADAACYPLFDGGNIGIRRRQYQRLMSSPDYKPLGSIF
ncbi:acyl-CoA dehydrogenase/oxidase [Stachybotrys elegans]|uniref:Acyl-CoA dehydrogenase/oxidase n=1 Tax=Stachybotrys elegans TaxID=80388 RepID=A0A8K0WLD0_9HYPO|nr:acyl-CoA dehydrogenase/oxidase [Stachybotrys elegans]